MGAQMKARVGRAFELDLQGRHLRALGEQRLRSGEWRPGVQRATRWPAWPRPLACGSGLALGKQRGVCLSAVWVRPFCTEVWPGELIQFRSSVYL